MFITAGPVIKNVGGVCMFITAVPVCVCVCLLLQYLCVFITAVPITKLFA